MKPALLRPQAFDDREAQARYYRQQAGNRVAVRMVAATHAALHLLEREPGIGSPTLGKALDIAALRCWRVKRVPLVWLYFERADHLDIVRLLGERQDIAAVLGAVD